LILGCSSIPSDRVVVAKPDVLKKLTRSGVYARSGQSRFAHWP
jgi:hypothetical protein